MKKIILCMLLGVIWGMTSCNNEDHLFPSEEDIYGYFVPQGDHDYDATIVEWKNKYNVFTLYKWTPKDLYWSPTGWTEFVPNEEGSLYAGTGNRAARMADENYVGQQLDLIYSQFMSFYSDSTLRRCLPLKIILCDSIERVNAIDGSRDFMNIDSYFDLLAFSWGTDKVLSMTTDQKNLFKVDVNQTFLKRLIDNGKITKKEQFFKLGDYSSSVTNTNMYARGFIESGTKAEDDWETYVKVIISTPYEELIAETGDKDYTNKGILNPMKDENGLIRKKYDIVVNHWKSEYNIDLQAIGNATIK